MKLTASLLGSGLASAAPKPIDVVKHWSKSASLETGTVITTLNGGLFRVTAAVQSPDGAFFRLQKPNGSIVTATKRDIEGMFPLTAGLQRLANVLKYVLAYNEDFDQYVKEAIRAAGLPVDETVNWAKWFKGTYESALPSSDRDLVDEAIHHVIIKELFERHTLQKFDPERMQKDQPLDKQVTGFLKGLFLRRLSEAKMYINRTYQNWEGDEGGKYKGRQTESIFQQGEEGEYNILDTDQHAQHNQDVQNMESDEDLNLFRQRFFDWLKETQRSQTAQNIQLVFDLILDSETGKQKTLRDDWVEETGLTPSSLKVAISKLGKFLQEFIRTHEAELGNHLIVQMIKELTDKKKVDKKVDKAVRSKASLNLSAADFAAPPAAAFNVPVDTGFDSPTVAPVSLMSSDKEASNNLNPVERGSTPSHRHYCSTCKDYYECAGGECNKMEALKCTKHAGAKRGHGFKGDDVLGLFDEPAAEPEPAKKDIYDPKYRFEERVRRLMNTKGLSLDEAQEVVRNVIMTKEAGFDDKRPELRVGPKKWGACCAECGDTVTEGEYETGTSACCGASVVPEEEYGQDRHFSSWEDNTDPCPKCEGRGSVDDAKDYNRPKECPRCHGKGRVKTSSEKIARDVNESEEIDGHTYRLTTWQERDRFNIYLEDECCNKEILNFWDDDAVAAIEDGFIDPRNMLESAVEYATSLGIIKSSHKMKASYPIKEGKSASEDTVKTADNKNDSLRNKVAATKAEREQKTAAVNKYAKLQEVASNEPHEILAAFNQMSDNFHQLGNAMDRMVARLGMPALGTTATLGQRLAAKRRFAESVKKFALDNPGGFSEAIGEFYEKVDEVADQIEALAENLGIGLPAVSAEPMDVIDPALPPEPGIDAAATDPGMAPPVAEPGMDVPDPGEQADAAGETELVQ